MSNLFKNILDSLKLTDDDDNEEYDDYVAEAEEKERRKQERMEQKMSNRPEKRSFSESRSLLREDSSLSAAATITPASNTSKPAEPKKERMASADRGNVSKVVPIRNAQKGLEVCIMKPTSFEDSQDICDMLLSGRAAVINLEGFDVDVAQRVMDFVSGAVYAMNGKLHQISSYIFIISPDNVDISGDYLDLIRQNGFEVPTFNKEF